MRTPITEKPPLNDLHAATMQAKRENAATRAMQTLLVNVTWHPSDDELRAVARVAVKSADALLAELAKPKGEGA